MKQNVSTVTYRTFFSLTTPVNDYTSASRYLREADMRVHLRDRVDATTTLMPDEITRCDWILTDDDAGYIECEFTRELTEQESRFVSEWISGQASDGLGEGFEQQPFARTWSDSDDYYREQYYDVDDGYEQYYEVDVDAMSSFDYRTNEYRLEKM